MLCHVCKEIQTTVHMNNVKVGVFFPLMVVYLDKVVTSL